MANKEHLEIIKQGVEAWNQWKIKEDNHRTRPDLYRADLHGADLRGAYLSEADLSEADLSEADLSKADLSLANLRRADLSKAYLGRVDLHGADLSEADLHRADLHDAYLYLANLRKANLRQVVLEMANLRRANLSEADLSKAVIKWTIFADNDLSTVKGLETINHHAPSTIGVDTLYNSEGNIPEVFLRGAGLPDDFITYLPSLTKRAIEFYSCFISYSHADKSFARRLHDALQGRGIRCWLDEHQLLPGEKIYTEVDSGIRLWDKVLLCCSKDALRSWWVNHEIDTAFDKEQRIMKERGKEVFSLIPLNLDGYLFGNECENSKATQIKTRFTADFIGWEHDNKIFVDQIEHLVKALRADAGAKEPPPPSKL